MDDPGPFCELPASLLQELTKAVYEHRAGLKHLLHLVIHPQTTSYEINPHGSSFVAMRLLGERKVTPTARTKKIFPNERWEILGPENSSNTIPYMALMKK